MATPVVVLPTVSLLVANETSHHLTGASFMQFRPSPDTCLRNGYCSSQAPSQLDEACISDSQCPGESRCTRGECGALGGSCSAEADCGANRESTVGNPCLVASYWEAAVHSFRLWKLNSIRCPRLQSHVSATLAQHWSFPQSEVSVRRIYSVPMPEDIRSTAETLYAGDMVHNATMITHQTNSGLGPDLVLSALPIVSDLTASKERV